MTVRPAAGRLVLFLAAAAAVGASLATAGCGQNSRAVGGAEAAFRADVKRVRAGGATIAHYERGDGPPLLMCMGSGSTMAEWDPALLRLLAKRNRLIIFDYPGIGLSRGGAEKGMTYARLAASAAGLLKAIGVGRASVLGWSMGSFVAQEMATRHPESVDKLVLAGTNPGGTHARLGPTWASDIDSDPDATEREVMSTLFTPNAAGRRAARAFGTRLDRAAETGEVPDDFDTPTASYRAQVRAEDRWLRSDANYNRLPRVTAGTVVTGGREDPLIPLANGRIVARRIPGARLVEFEGSHAYLFQFHGRFAREVNRFLGTG